MFKEKNKEGNFLTWYLIFIAIGIIWAIWGMFGDHKSNPFLDAEEQYYHGDEGDNFYAP